MTALLSPVSPQRGNASHLNSHAVGLSAFLQGNRQCVPLAPCCLVFSRPLLRFFLSPSQTSALLRGLLFLVLAGRRGREDGCWSISSVSPRMELDSHRYLPTFLPCSATASVNLIKHLVYLPPPG